MSIAHCLIRPGPLYRSEAFHAGLMACGYQVKTAAPAKFEHGDVLVTWSRYGAMHDLAVRAEAAGVPVIVAENAYIWEGGISPHHLKDRPAYALARGYHNDSTVIPDGDGSRWAALDIELKPWRVDGEHILICPNRPFGTPGRIMPGNWAEDCAKRLRTLTKRPVRVRAHPGNYPPAKPLAEDLAGAWACVIWSSSAGVHTLVAGVPVFCEAPFWICKAASDENIRYIDRPLTDTTDTALRLAALHRLAWGQFSVEEIASGFAFTSVLHPAGQEKIPASA